MASEIGNLVLTEPQVDEEAGNTLRFTANEASTVNMVNYTISPTVYYRINGTGAYAQMTGQTFSLSAGDYMDIYGNNPSGFSTGEYDNYSRFNTTGNVSVSGNIMALISKDSQPSTIPCDCCFNGLFLGSTGITDASNLRLPAETLTTCCYGYMFSGCTNLVSAPNILPARIASPYCCYNMFRNCTKLVNAPELPAMTVEYFAYSTMFRGCTSLVNAPELPARIIGNYCYEAMFYGCTSLVNGPKILPAKTLAECCYMDMFYSCSSLVNAPTLPAKTLVTECYNYMFYGCSSLSNIRAYFTTTPTTSYTNNWVSSVKASGTFVMGPAASWSVVSTYGIPSGWTSRKASY